MLKVNELFHSIQTEGPYVGTPATFIRLAGCNLACSFCDTFHLEHEEYTSKQLVEMCDHMLVVITGGEPFLQDFTGLAAMLLDRGFYVQVETNGTQNPHEYFKELEEREMLYDMDIVCSPKPNASIHPEMAQYVNAYKILCDETTTHKDVMKWKDDCSDDEIPVFLQPLMRETLIESMPNILHTVELCKGADMRLSLQYHKLINIP